MKPEDCISCAVFGGKEDCATCLHREKEKRNKEDPNGLKEFISGKFDALHARINELEKQIKDLQFDNDVANGKVQ